MVAIKIILRVSWCYVSVICIGWEFLKKQRLAFVFICACLFTLSIYRSLTLIMMIFLRRSRGSWFPQNEQAGVASTHFPIIMNFQLFTLPLFPLLVVHCIIHSEPLTGLRCTCLSANSRATRQVYIYVPHQLLTTSFRHIQPSPLLA